MNKATDCLRSRPFFCVDVWEMGMPVMKNEK
jgi:hypothetical protein